MQNYKDRITVISAGSSWVLLYQLTLGLSYKTGEKICLPKQTLVSMPYTNSTSSSTPLHLEEASPADEWDVSKGYEYIKCPTGCHICSLVKIA